MNIDYQVSQAYYEPHCQALPTLEPKQEIQDIAKTMAIMQQRIETMQQRTNEAIQDLVTQIGQLASCMSELKA